MFEIVFFGKAEELEFGAIETGEGERHDEGAGTRRCSDRDFFKMAALNELGSGIGDAWCSGIRDESDVFSGMEFRDDFILATFFIEFVKTSHGNFDAKMVQENAAVACIFA